MAMESWREMFRECLGGRYGQYWEEVVPLLVAVDQGVKPSFLWDVCTADTSGLLALLNQARTKGFLMSKLVLVELGLDVFIVNVAAVTRTLVGITTAAPTWLIDISGPEPKLASNENHQEFRSHLASIIAQLNTATDDVGSGIAPTPNGGDGSPQALETSKEIKAMEVKLPEDLNLSTIFGCMLGYPHIYWWQGESGGNSLSGMPLKVFKLSADCSVDGSSVELFSFSIPEALEGELRPGIEHWGNVTNVRIEQATSFSNARFRHGRVQEAWNHVCVAQLACPQDPNAQDTGNRLTNALVDRWHLPMLNDKRRNLGFKQAIERAVVQGHLTILDIGSGTGLFSLYGRNAGATEVYACEVDKFMCEMGLNILQLNPSTSSIKMINKHSTNITIPSDIPKRLSLVVSETVDAGLFGEHILSTLHHAWQHLLLPPHREVNSPSGSCKVEQQEDGGLETKKTICKEEGSDNSSTISHPISGRVIPSSAEVFVAFINCDYISKQTKLVNSDFQYFKGKNVCLKLQEPYMSEKLSQVPGGFKLLSEWTWVTTVDFNSPDDIMRHLNGEINKSLSVECTNSGTLDAIALAFKLHVDDHECISTFPGAYDTVWENALYPVLTNFDVIEFDTIPVNVQCNGVLKFSIKTPPLVEETIEDPVKLNTSALRFLNNKNFTSAYLTAAQSISTQLRSSRGDTVKNQPRIIISDTTPFPVAGMSLLSDWPNSRLYVEDADTQAALRKIGVEVELCEDLEDPVDVLFLWPFSGEGTLRDEIVRKVLLYRLMMAENGFTFPHAVDLIIGLMNSPTLTTMTRVDDSNTCGIKMAEVFNVVQTVHQLDVPLSSLPDTVEVDAPIPVLRLSLSSGLTEPLVPAIPEAARKEKQLLVLGGEIVEVSKNITFSQASTITALPYWFQLRGSFSTSMGCGSQSRASSSGESQECGVILSTRDADSPCNQSILMLKEPIIVEAGDKALLKVVWREGVFSASLHHHPSH